jgi:hypothetical protein
MNNIASFNQLVDLAMKQNGHSHMRPVIAKELLHYDILFCLEDNGLLDQLTFQGGTSLRLCYGSARFSEDLDFVGGYDFTTKDLMGIKACLEKYIGERYRLEIHVKEPKDTALLQEYKDIKVDKWQISVTTSPERKDLPKQRIKFEVANIPAYSQTYRSLLKNYSFLPDGYSDTIIITESLDEIMADKLISLVGCQRYVRHRDIWDLRWLKQQGAKINEDYIAAKIKDYKESDYLSKLDSMIDKIDQIIRGKNFINELSRFIPMEAQERTLMKPKFLELLINENKTMLLQVKTFLS